MILEILKCKVVELLTERYLVICSIYQESVDFLKQQPQQLLFLILFCDLIWSESRLSLARGGRQEGVGMSPSDSGSGVQSQLPKDFAVS